MFLSRTRCWSWYQNASNIREDSDRKTTRLWKDCIWMQEGSAYTSVGVHGKKMSILVIPCESDVIPCPSTGWWNPSRLQAEVSAQHPCVGMNMVMVSVIGLSWLSMASRQNRLNGFGCSCDYYFLSNVAPAVISVTFKQAYWILTVHCHREMKIKACQHFAGF